MLKWSKHNHYGENMHNKNYLMVLGGSVGATLLMGAAAVMPNAFAATQATSSTATVTVSSTCSMTGTVVTPHTATVNNGSYTPDIGTTNLTAFCNDPNGFSIYAIGYTGDTRGQTMLHSDSVGSTYDIQTGVAGGNTSEWSMKLASQTTGTSIDNGYTNYSVVPSQYTRVAFNNSTTDATVGSTVTTTYAARISQTQPAGTYTGQVKYILVHPSGDTPSELPKMQDVDNWGEQILVGEEIVAQDTRDNNTYTVARLCVERDGNNNCTADQLWMTQNLDFAPSSAVTYTHANTDLGWTTGDSSATWTPLAATMSSPAYITNFSSGNPANSVSGWTNDYNKPHYAEGKYYDTSTSSFTTDEIIVYNGTKYQGRAACVSAGHTGAQCDHYKVGNYYNWPAAIASNDASGITAQYTVAPNSVCPAGWRLPKGITNNGTSNVQSEFNALLLANGVVQNSITESTATAGGTNAVYTGNGWSLINSGPLYFVRSGRVYDTTLYYFTSLGYYWSSTAVSSSLAYGLVYDSGGAYPANRNARNYGWSLRCVAR